MHLFINWVNERPVVALVQRYSKGCTVKETNDFTRLMRCSRNKKALDYVRDPFHHRHRSPSRPRFALYEIQPFDSRQIYRVSTKSLDNFINSLKTF